MNVRTSELFHDKKLNNEQSTTPQKYSCKGDYIVIKY